MKQMNFQIEYLNKITKLENASPEYETLSKLIEKDFGLKSGEYTLSYLDIDNDPIAIEDEDDLAVCILEFSEMSNIDEPVKLLVLAKDPSIPRRRDTPKGSRGNSRKNSTEVKKVNMLTEDSFKKVESDSVVMVEDS